MLEDSLGSYDVTVMGSFDRTTYEGSTLGLSPGYTEVEAIGSEECMVPETDEVYLYLQKMSKLYFMIEMSLDP